MATKPEDATSGTSMSAATTTKPLWVTRLETALQNRRDRVTRVLDRMPTTYPQQVRYKAMVQSLLNATSDRTHLAATYTDHFEKLKNLVAKKSGVVDISEAEAAPKEQHPAMKKTTIPAKSSL